MIAEVKWNSYRHLGDLALDFKKSDGSIYNTIILAGENGTGKTTILDTLSTFLNFGTFEPFADLLYEVDENYYLLEPLSDESRFGFNNRTKLEDHSCKAIRYSKTSMQNGTIDNEDIRTYGCLYSKAHCGFPTKPITSSTTQQVDTEIYDDGNMDDYTPIKQLLVDLYE